MILFLDTEFTDFHRPLLISLALVSECGRHEFYAERTDYSQERCSDFVRASVLPKLGRCEVGPGALDGPGLTRALREWLVQIHALDSGHAVLVLHDFTTDFDLLKEALAAPVPAWLSGINIAGELNESAWQREGLEALPEAHHALHDARELRTNWLRTRAGKP